MALGGASAALLSSWLLSSPPETCSGVSESDRESSELFWDKMSTFCGWVVAGSSGLCSTGTDGRACADISELDTTARFCVWGVALGVASGVEDTVPVVAGATLSLPDPVSGAPGCLDCLPLTLTMAGGLVLPPWEGRERLDGLEVTVVL